MDGDIPSFEGPDSTSYPTYSSGYAEGPSPVLDPGPYTDGELGRDITGEDLTSE